SMEVIVHRIHSVTHEQLVVLANASWSRSLSRNQPCDGMAFCRGVGNARSESPGGDGGDPAYRFGARALYWRCGQPAMARAKESANAGHTLWRCCDHFWLRLLSPGSFPLPDLGRHARRLPRPDFMVVYDGIRSWRGFDAGANHTRRI